MRTLAIIGIYTILIILQGCSPQDDRKVCPEANCRNYATQQQAQAAYDADPECMDALDNDNDKIACEELSSGGGGGGTGCPTTSNCGCSGKKKDNCASACCKWVVNNGCKCK